MYFKLSKNLIYVLDLDFFATLFANRPTQKIAHNRKKRISRSRHFLKGKEVTVVLFLPRADIVCKKRAVFAFWLIFDKKSKIAFKFTFLKFGVARPFFLCVGPLIPCVYKRSVARLVQKRAAARVVLYFSGSFPISPAPCKGAW